MLKAFLSVLIIDHLIFAKEIISKSDEFKWNDHFFLPKDHKESWALKNWCFWTVVLEKTFESSLDCKEIKPVNPKGNQPWIFIGRTDAEAETVIFWPPATKNQLIWKDSDAGKDWGQEEEGMTEDEMIEWHHRLNGHEFEQALGDGEGQRGLACCSPWGHKELDMTEQLNWTEVREGRNKGKAIKQEK